jgi:hypothetical protein
VEDDFHEGREAQGDIGRGWHELVDEVIECPAESNQQRVFGVALDFHGETSFMVWRLSAVAIDRMAGRLHPQGRNEVKEL